MNMRLLLTLSALLLLASCETTSSRLTHQAVEQVWVGRNSDAFFAQYGLPAATYQTSTGDKIHTWKSEVVSMSMPGTVTTDVQPGFTDDTVLVTTTSSPGSTLSSYCVLLVHTTAGNRIKSIDIQKDTDGVIKFSRFDEIFSKDPEVKAVKQGLKAAQ